MAVKVSVLLKPAKFLKMRKRAFIFFASPGGGKDTQTTLLRNYFEDFQIPFLYVGTGEEIRKIEKTNYTVNLLNKTITEGKLAPDFLAESIVINAMMHGFKKEMNLVLNGFPRNTDQAEKLLEITGFYSIKPSVIFIKVSEEEAIRRIILRPESRSDDNSESIKNRFEIFNNENVCLINYFKRHFHLIEIDGNGTPEEIHKKILESL